VSVVLTPETPELDALLREADARWEAAGVAAERIVIGPGGAPVRLVPERAPAAETLTRGRGKEFAGVRWMELYNLDIAVAMHELGHALGIKYHHDELVTAADVENGAEPPPCGEVSTRATMCSHVGNLIRTEDLELACDAGACMHFTPEAP